MWVEGEDRVGGGPKNSRRWKKKKRGGGQEPRNRRGNRVRGEAAAFHSPPNRWSNSPISPEKEWPKANKGRLTGNARIALQ